MSGTIADKDIHLRINLSEKNAEEAARRSTSMLHLILQGSPHEGIEDALRRALAQNPKLAVRVGLDLASSAYGRLRFSPFVGKKPTTEQTADALNYIAFVKAVDLIYAGSGFGTQGFPDLVDEHKDWARYNLTAIDREDSTRPPNRRQIGSSNTDSVWPQDATTFPAATVDRSFRRLLRLYMIAGQQFMNLCEDLPKLSQNLDAASTEEALKDVIDEAGDFVQEAAGPFPLFFTKPLAAALVKQARGVVTEVIAPGLVGTAEEFNINISIV
jgi:hypothetical protein